MLNIVMYLDNSGVLLIVANYTGDVFNFGLACERAKKIDNINVNYSYIVDCLARKTNLHTKNNQVFNFRWPS